MHYAEVHIATANEVLQRGGEYGVCSMLISYSFQWLVCSVVHIALRTRIVKLKTPKADNSTREIATLCRIWITLGWLIDQYFTHIAQ